MGAPFRRRRRPAGLSRREFLKRTGATSSLLLAPPLLAACGRSDPPAPATSEVFRHGIATGDPLPDRVIFWTRITSPDGLPADVILRVFADPGLTQPVVEGVATAGPARDFTVKIDQAGLAPGTTYYYRFEALGVRSRVGRTRTAPQGAVARLRFGVVSCASYAHGYFNAYRHLAARHDLDAILHLGDYLYEYGDGQYGSLRGYQPPHEILTLADYRARHAHYKQDPDLAELHRQFPFFTTWDDHESADNSWRDGAENHESPGEGDWTGRKAAAQQAFDEWMPIRYPQAGNTNRIWRRFSYGDLADLVYLDTRLYDRDEPGGIPVDNAVANDPDRRLLGPEQMTWLQGELAGSAAKWKLLAQQVVFMQWNVNGATKDSGLSQRFNGDAWDGYNAERQQIIDFLRAQNVDNVVILTGDVHSSWAADITDDPNNPLAYNPATGAGSVAVEFVTTGITPPFTVPVPAGTDAFRGNNPHIRYLELVSRGYLVLDVTPQRVQGEWWYVSTFTQPGATESFGTAYSVDDGTNTLSQSGQPPSDPPPDPPPPAP